MPRGTRSSHDQGVRPTHFDQATDRDTLAAVNAVAAALLTAEPRRRAALSYLRERGIDGAALPDEWPLGYAPPGWTRLVDHLTLDFTDQVLLDAGLARRSSRGSLIDVFRDRVMFPLHDVTGRIVGFIGRDRSGHSNAPRYLNTGQNSLFNKGHLLSA